MVDREIVRLLAEREGYVRQAARFKKTRADVEAKERAEEVVGKVLAVMERVRPDVTLVPMPFLDYPGMVDALVDWLAAAERATCSGGSWPSETVE
jgi:isochorismate pyruvate lyase